MTSSTQNQHFSHPLLGGLISALLFTFLWRLIGDLSTIFAIIPLFIITLKIRDLKTLAPSFGLALMLVMLLLGLPQAFNYVLYVAAPALIFPRLALQTQKPQTQTSKGKKQWYPLERLMGALGLYAFGATLILTVVWHIMGVAPSTLLEITEKLQHSSLDLYKQNKILLTYLKLLWPYVPGISMGVFVIMMAISTSLTQRWFTRKKLKFPRPPLKLSTLYIPWWCWKAFAGFGILAALGISLNTTTLHYVFGNALVPLVALFLLQGLSVVMTFIKKQKNPKMFLVIFYGFVLVFGWTLLILILAGLLEPWLDLRTRLSQTKEKE